MTSTIINQLKLATGIVNGVSDTWKTVRLPYSYDEMVVVGMPCYDDSQSGAVVRIRNADQASMFQVRVENPNSDAASSYYVHYIVAEAGVYENEAAGIKIEAQRITSDLVDGVGSWVGRKLITHQLYENPVVLGQVMSANDAWSTFWSKEGTASELMSAYPTIPSGYFTDYLVGRHVGSDPNNQRLDEVLGLIIFEAGSGEINGIQFTAGHTETVVSGRQEDAFSQPLDMLGLTAVASTASMNGGDGCWPVLWGENGSAPFQSRNLALKVDEDQITDDEQAHLAEKVAYLVLNGEKDSARFLAQAGLGGYLNVMRGVSRNGYGAWIDAQKYRPISLTQPYMDDITRVQTTYYRDNAESPNPDPNIPTPQEVSGRHPFWFFFPVQGTNAGNFSTSWMRNIVHQSDQLRQRVAWTLSQIMVVSFKGSNGLRAIGRSFASYYDTLATHALGNFRDLLLAVSLHPLMAYYLSSLGNQKTDGTRQPDENYAREVMQLFSIGLWKLHNNGTQDLDTEGKPQPTYDNNDVTELARVFTGLWYEGQDFGLGGLLRDRQNGVIRTGSNPAPSYTMIDLTPLAMFEDYHDQGAKTVLGETIPAGQNGMKDIEDAIDILFNHPNTPPFISRRLIQFMVTSNPSPGYIERVANVFIDNGQGVRGDLHATVRQILLDKEARFYRPYTPDNVANVQYGKLMEPMIRLTRAVKAFRAGETLQPDDYSDPYNPVFNDLVFWRHFTGDSNIDDFGQWPLYSNSVFNFFEPDYQHGGVLTDENDNNLYSPEFQIFNPVTATTMPNELTRILEGGLHRLRLTVTPEFAFNFTTEIALAPSADALLDRLDLLLTEGQMSDGTRTVIKNVIQTMPYATEAERADRVHVAVFGVLVSPDCAIMR